MVALRRLFVEAVQEVDFTRFVFVDEMALSIWAQYQPDVLWHYGRAPQGRRLGQAVPVHSGPNVTLLAALTPDGLAGPC